MQTGCQKVDSMDIKVQIDEVRRHYDLKKPIVMGKCQTARGYEYRALYSPMGAITLNEGFSNESFREAAARDLGSMGISVSPGHEMLIFLLHEIGHMKLHHFSRSIEHARGIGAFRIADMRAFDVLAEQEAWAWAASEYQSHWGR